MIQMVSAGPTRLQSEWTDIVGLSAVDQNRIQHHLTECKQIVGHALVEGDADTTDGGHLFLEADLPVSGSNYCRAERESNERYSQ